MPSPMDIPPDVTMYGMAIFLGVLIGMAIIVGATLMLSEPKEDRD